MPSGAILVLDDAPEMRSIFAQILREDGWHAIATSDPDEALRLAQGQQLAAAIFDLRLGNVGGGASFYAALRAGGHSFPAILCSAWHGAREIAASLGVPFVPKPFDIDVLLTVVSSAVRGHSPEQQGRSARKPQKEGARVSPCPCRGSVDTRT